MSRVIAVTGASAGIGRATAIRLARDGASLVLCARRTDPLQDAAAEVIAAGGQAVPLVADVSSDTDMQRVVDTALERFGRLDVMICNAGFGIYGTIDTITPEQMRRLVDVNFMGTYHAVRAALPVFRRQGQGHVIIVSSIVGKRGVPFMGAYSATKFAQVGLAECLRAEVAGSGIHVSVVYPISTESDFFKVMTGESGTATRAAGPRQPVSAVAGAIARTIARPVPEVFPYGMSRWLGVLNAVAPGLTDQVVKRWARQPIPAEG
jgi:NAD(P)-dependent dehydrogenase (short-subunit alcohol dehydrogenase family)